MKKIALLLAVAMTMLLSACVGSSSNDNKVTREFAFVSRTTGPDLDGVQLCLNTISLEINYTDNTVVSKVTLALGSNKTIYFQTDPLSLSYDAAVGATVFGTRSITATSGDVIDAYNVQWNTATGVMLFNIVVDGSYLSIGNTNLGYVDCNLHSVYNAEKEGESDEVNLSDVQVAFTLDASNHKATMYLYNIQLSSTEARQVNVAYTDIDYVATTDGFEFSTKEAAASASSTYYNITDLKATLSDQTRRLNMTFKSGDHDVTISGRMFVGNQ